VTVYLDHAAGAPLGAEAAAAMMEWLTGAFGNPSGAHHVARRARAAVDESRDRVAEFLGVEPGGVVFTSGGTEADNLAVLGPVLAGRPGAVVVSAVEHPAVLEAARASGREVRVAAVGPDGMVDAEQLRKVLDKDVAVVSVQLANHETGVVQDIPRLAARVRKWAPGAVFHTDAVQGAPWLPLPEATAGADLVTVSAHKLGGPQGAGALGIRGGVEVAPVLRGGGQEAERRSGTHNVAAIAGLAAAVGALDPSRGPAVAARRDRLWAAVSGSLPGALRTAAGSPLVPGHLHLRIPGADSESMVFLLDEMGVCASAGAACASGAAEPSPVLLAMGVDKSEAACALRLTLGPATTDADVDAAAAAVAAAALMLKDAAR
jgi:cysteine desulfurase